MSKVPNHIARFQLVYGVIISAIIPLTVAWTVYGSRIDSLEKNDIKQDVRIESNNLTIQEINQSLASIETSIENMEKQLNRIYNRQ